MAIPLESIKVTPRKSSTQSVGRYCSIFSATVRSVALAPWWSISPWSAMVSCLSCK